MLRIKNNNNGRGKYCQMLFIKLCLLFYSISSTAQTVLLDSLSLDTLKAFTSIEDAMKQPDKVLKLILKRDKLKTIPEEVFLFVNLQYLDLSRNVIAEIPTKIQQLRNLQFLSFEKNKLEKLPPEIGKLTNLYYLNVGQNDLVAIPPEIGKLERLRYLDAWFNNLNTFPNELANLKNLKKFDLNSIIISDKEKKRIQSLLPTTKIYFANGCGCLN